MEGYSLLKVVGEGSFGRALLVQRKNTLEHYVVKEIQLPKNLSKAETSRREAVLLSKMSHPNIVAFREAFEADGLLCIVMEYCSGGDLLQRIQRQRAAMFPVSDILRWFAEMCAGTKHIHAKRILHRDLKSKNIFLTDSGTAKLGDFGSACLLNSSRAYARSYVGTPYYVSPEIWDNRPYNNKSDVWSLGCVLYELCTLHHPFQASSWKSLILKVCRGSYRPLPRALPYELHFLLRQMFKTDPRDRPSLHTILTSHRVSSLLRKHLPSQATQAEEVEEERRRRRTGRWRRAEGEEVVTLLGQKSLISTSTLEGAEGSGPHGAVSTEPRVRKQWPADPPETLLRMFGNASLLSTGRTRPGPARENTEEEPSSERRPRRKWDRNPPERLLSLLEKAQFNAAFRTFTISRGAHPLLGPLSGPQGDDLDGSEQEQEVEVDGDRMEPRSDDDDTDFEEDSPCDWIRHLEETLAETERRGQIQTKPE